jgi:NADP-dependent 3-hydroxy acid dehydrogenase YdfG
MLAINPNGAIMSPAATEQIAAISGAASVVGHAGCRLLPRAGLTAFGLDRAERWLDRAERWLETAPDRFAAVQTRFRWAVSDVADSGGARAWVNATTTPVHGATQTAFVPHGLPCSPGSR